jgi:hypothetical protein
MENEENEKRDLILCKNLNVSKKNEQHWTS